MKAMVMNWERRADTCPSLSQGKRMQMQASVAGRKM